MQKLADTFSWGDLKVERVTSTDATAVRAVSNGPALSILFDSAQFNLSDPESPQNLTWAAAFTVPIKQQNQGPQYFQELVRGFVKKDADSRVLLLLDLGGEVRARHYHFGKKIEEDLVLESIYRSTGQPPLHTYVINVFIAIERRTPDSVVLVAIDSIDIDATPGKPAAKGPDATRKKRGSGSQC